MTIRSQIAGMGLLAVAALALGAANSTPRLQAAEIDDLPRDKNKFSYFRLGRHVPPRSGYANYTAPRTVIHPNIGLPLEIKPRNNEHMYCNTQVWGFLGNGKPGGKSNHEKNYSFPWTSTFCEQRWPPAPQQTLACGPTAPIAHQGSDCRPPAAKADTYWMTAVEDGVISEARHNLVTLVGSASGIRWKYRHGNTPIVRKDQLVRKGERLAQITDLGSTPIHMHLESERPVGGVMRDVDNLPSLIVAYQKELGNPTTVQDRELGFDPNFEIEDGTVSANCGSEHSPVIATIDVSRISSLWCHNGSVMGLVKDGAKREFVYYKPRNADLAQAVRGAPMLFTGELMGGKVAGQARHYSSRCGDRTFQAQGDNPQPDRLIQVAGNRPVFAGNDCTGSIAAVETLVFSFLRNFDASEVVASPLDPERKSKTEITRNWGAITMYVPWENWLPYVKNWPGLSLDANNLPFEKALQDKFGGFIPALETDESGVGIWWYWLAVRKAFTEAGKPTFRQIAVGIAGEEAGEAAIQNYIGAYTRISQQYFGRGIGADEAIDLTNPEQRWALAWTMFHHEAGRTPLISRAVFDCGVRLGGEAIRRDVTKFKEINYRTFVAPLCGGIETPIPPTTETPPDLASKLAVLASKVEQLTEQNAGLQRRVDDLTSRLGAIRTIVINQP
jgi:hypothetical protein